MGAAGSLAGAGQLLIGTAGGQVAERTAAEAETAELQARLATAEGEAAAATDKLAEIAPRVAALMRTMPGTFTIEEAKALTNLAVDLEVELRNVDAFMSALPPEARAAIRSGEAEMRAIQSPISEKHFRRLIRMREICWWGMVAGAAWGGVACWFNFFAGDFASATIMAFLCGANAGMALMARHWR